MNTFSHHIVKLLLFFGYFILAILSSAILMIDLCTKYSEQGCTAVGLTHIPMTYGMLGPICTFTHHITVTITTLNMVPATAM